MKEMKTNGIIFSSLFPPLEKSGGVFLFSPSAFVNFSLKPVGKLKISAFFIDCDLRGQFESDDQGVARMQAQKLICKLFMKYPLKTALKCPYCEGLKFF